jgi:hypothetical protein
VPRRELCAAPAMLREEMVTAGLGACVEIDLFSGGFVPVEGPECLLTFAGRPGPLFSGCPGAVLSISGSTCRFKGCVALP